MTAIDGAEVERRFSWPAPTEDQAARVAAIHDHVKELASWLNDELPVCRESEEAFAALELVQFWGVIAASRPAAPAKNAERPQITASGHLQSTERSWTPRVSENFHIGFGRA